MNRTDRRLLAQQTQALDREHPEWNARELDAELAMRAPVAYGSWAESTPELASRRRSIQRWRGPEGSGAAPRAAGLLFPYLWPVGERQRHELEPGYVPSSRLSAGSWRIFLYNCSPETVREIHVTLDRAVVGYSPFLLPGRFTELLWQRVPAIKEVALADVEPRLSDHPLRVLFVLARGTREGRLEGTLRLRNDQGWAEFDGGGGRRKELE